MSYFLHYKNKQNNLELILNSHNNNLYMSISAYSNLTNISDSIIIDRIKNNNIDTIIADIDTGFGIKKCRILDISIISKWLVIDSPDISIILINLAFNSLGSSISILNNLNNNE